jgi:hypothetical protein
MWNLQSKYLSCREGQQGDVAGPFDRGCQAALVRGAYAGEAARHDLPALGHKLLQQPHVLIVDIVNLFDAELADLLAAKEFPTGITRSPAGTVTTLAISAIATVSGPGLRAAGFSGCFLMCFVSHNSP